MLATKEKSHPGFQLPTAALHPGFAFAISNTATEFDASVYDFCGGPRSSGYFRDAETGNDYAKNRYHQPGMGRFLTPDSDKAGVRPSSPGSWNRYAYTRGDPVNRVDRTGRDDGFVAIGCDDDDDDCSDDPCDPDSEDYDPNACGSGGGGGGAPPSPSPAPCQNLGTSQQISFIEANYGAASAEAATIQSELPTPENSNNPIQINQTSLTNAFLEWSAWESGWGGSPLATNQNNFFGYGNVTFSSSTTWGTELALILAAVPSTNGNPNPGNAPYSSFLILTLANNPNASAAQILQSLANAGYNTNPNYGNQIAGPNGINVQPLIDCLQSNNLIK
jgi:RHS repeat-associated protein